MGGWQQKCTNVENHTVQKLLLKREKWVNV